MTKKVSILISCYNREETLPRSLWLLDNQTWPDYEVVFVDDGSTDDLKPYFTNREHIRFERIDRHPEARTRECNIGLRYAFERASGDFIIISHAEILVPKTAIEQLVSEYEEGRRICPVLYFIPTYAMMTELNNLDWKNDLDQIQRLSGFWDEPTHWANTNMSMKSWIAHTGFAGQSRDAWLAKGFLPDDELRGSDVAWLDAREVEHNSPPKQASFAIYHQKHGDSGSGYVSQSVRLARGRYIQALKSDSATAEAARLDLRAAETAMFNSTPMLISIVVDTPEWAHDFKTDSLIAREPMADMRIQKVYQRDLTPNRVADADLVFFYYLGQLNNYEMRQWCRQNIHKVLIGICDSEGSPRAVSEEIAQMAIGSPVVNESIFKTYSDIGMIRNLFLTPNGVETKFFTPAGYLPRSPDKLVVGWAGNLAGRTTDKGYESILLPALSRIGNVELRTASPQRDRLTREEMPDFYRGLDVYVCTSDLEGTPNPNMEAASCGIPVVTTAVGVMPQFIVDGKNGILLRSRSSEELASVLTDLANNKGRLVEMGAAARKTAEAWDWDVMANAYFDAFWKFRPRVKPERP